MIHPLRAALVCFATLGGCVWGCHAIVGADEFTVEGPVGGAAGSTSSGGGGTTTSTSAGGSGGGGGDGGANLCPPTGLEDGFGGSSFGPLWTTWGNLDLLGVANDHGFLEASAGSSRNGGIDTSETHDLTGCAVWLEIRRVPDPTIGAQAQFMIGVDNANHAAFGIRQGELSYVVWVDGNNVGGNTVSYQMAPHRWLRFRDDQGRLRLEASPDASAVAWTELDAVDTPWWIADVQVNLTLEVWSPTGEPAQFIFDNLNRLP